MVRVQSAPSFFLTAFLCLLLSAPGASPAFAQESTRPNILWLISEDMGPELGAYGTPALETPELDGLARRGVLYTNAFTTAPVCSPSRSAFNTGMYQTTIGAHNHRSHKEEDGSVYPWPLPEGVRLITNWLRDAGYYTGNIVHLPPEVQINGQPVRGNGKTDWNFTFEGKPFDTDTWADLKAHQPFYAQINFPETHRGSEWDTAHERVYKQADPQAVVVPPYYPDHPVVRADWAQYFNSIMSLDRKIGLVLDQLERDGMADNTVVIFFGDNGRAMMRGKQWPYDSGLHVPMIVYWPEGLPKPAGYRAGEKDSQLISAIDITATTLAIAGITKPEKMEGRVFLGPQAESPRRYVYGGRDRGDETLDRIRTVRDERFRYIRNYYPDRPLLQTNRYKETNYPTIWVMRKLYAGGKLDSVQAYLLAPTRPREELYDTKNDPYEIHNLAGNPEYTEVQHRLSTVLDEWIEKTGDQGQIPEDPAVQEYYEERALRNYGERIEKLRKEWGVE